MQRVLSHDSRRFAKSQEAKDNKLNTDGTFKKMTLMMMTVTMKMFRALSCEMLIGMCAPSVTDKVMK